MLPRLHVAVILVGSLLAVGSGDEVSADLCGLQDGVFPNPDDCKTFIRCQSGTPDLEPCPEGLLFNPFLFTCDFSLTENCTDPEDFDSTSASVPTSDITCSNDVPNILPIESSCSDYYLCENGTAFKVHCPSELLMNKVRTICDYKENVEECDVASDSEESTAGIAAIYEDKKKSETEAINDMNDYSPDALSSTEKSTTLSITYSEEISTKTQNLVDEISSTTLIPTDSTELTIDVTREQVSEIFSETSNTNKYISPSAEVFTTEEILEISSEAPPKNKISEALNLSTDISATDTFISSTTQGIFMTDIKTSDVAATDLITSLIRTTTGKILENTSSDDEILTETEVSNTEIKSEFPSSVTKEPIEEVDNSSSTVQLITTKETEVSKEINQISSSTENLIHVTSMNSETPVSLTKTVESITNQTVDVFDNHTEISPYSNVESTSNTYNELTFTSTDALRPSTVEKEHELTEKDFDSTVSSTLTAHSLGDSIEETNVDDSESTLTETDAYEEITNSENTRTEELFTPGIQTNSKLTPEEAKSTTEALSDTEILTDITERSTEGDTTDHFIGTDITITENSTGLGTEYNASSSTLLDEKENFVSTSDSSEIVNPVTETVPQENATATDRETASNLGGNTSENESLDPTTLISTLPEGTENISSDTTEVVNLVTDTEPGENKTGTDRETALPSESTISGKESSDPTTLISTLPESTKNFISTSDSIDVRNSVTVTEPGENTKVDLETTVLPLEKTTSISEIIEPLSQTSGRRESSETTTLISAVPENTNNYFSSESTEVLNPISETKPEENAKVTDHGTKTFPLGSTSGDSSDFTTRISTLPESTKNLISTSTEVMDLVTDTEPENNAKVTVRETTDLHLESTTTRKESSDPTTLISTLPEGTNKYVSTSGSTVVTDPVTKRDPRENATVSDRQTVFPLENTTSISEIIQPITSQTSGISESSYPMTLISTLPESTKDFPSTLVSTEVANLVTDTETEPEEKATITDPQTALPLENITTISEIRQPVTLQTSGRKESPHPTTISTASKSTKNFIFTSTEVASRVTDTEPDDVTGTVRETTALHLISTTSGKESSDPNTLISTLTESTKIFVSTSASTEVVDPVTDTEPENNATVTDRETTVMHLGSTDSTKESTDSTTLISTLPEGTNKLISTSASTEVTENESITDRRTVPTTLISTLIESTNNFISTSTEVANPITDTETEPIGNETVTDLGTTSFHLGSTTPGEDSSDPIILSTLPESTNNFVSTSTEVASRVTDTEPGDVTGTVRETTALHLGSTTTGKKSSDPTISISTLPEITKNFVSTSTQVTSQVTDTETGEDITGTVHETTALHLGSTASTKESTDSTTLISTLPEGTNKFSTSASTEVTENETITDRQTEPTTLISTLIESTNNFISTSTEVANPVTDTETEPIENETVTDRGTSFHLGSTTLGEDSSDPIRLSTLPESTNNFVSTSTQVASLVTDIEPGENVTVTVRETTSHLGSTASGKDSSDPATLISTLPESTKNMISTSTEVTNPITDAETEPLGNETVTDRGTTYFHLGSTTTGEDSSDPTTLISTLPESTNNFVSTSTQVTSLFTDTEPGENETRTVRETSLPLVSTTTGLNSSDPTILISTSPEITKNFVSTTQITSRVTDTETGEDITGTVRETTALYLGSTSEKESPNSTTLITTLPESTNNFVSTSTEVTNPISETESEENATVTDRETTVLHLGSSTSRKESSDLTTLSFTLPESTENFFSTSASTEVTNPVFETGENTEVTDRETAAVKFSTTSGKFSSDLTTLISTLSESTKKFSSTSDSTEVTNPITDIEPEKNATVTDLETTALYLGSTAFSKKSSHLTTLISTLPEGTITFVSTSASTEVTDPVAKTEPVENATVTDRETTVLHLERTTSISEITQPVTSPPSERKESSDPTSLISILPETTKNFSTSDSTKFTNPAIYTEPQNATVTYPETMLPFESTTLNSICIKPSGFYPTPGNCNTFYKCEKGVPEISSCTENNHFNPVKMLCEDPCLAKCDENADCPTTETEVTPERSTSESMPEDIVSSTTSVSTDSTLFTTSEIQTAKTWMPDELISTNDLTLNETSISPPLYFSTDFENISSHFTTEATSNTDISTHEVTTHLPTLIDELTESSSLSFTDGYSHSVTDGNENSTLTEKDSTTYSTRDYITSQSTHEITSTSVSVTSEESEKSSIYTSIGTTPDIEDDTTESTTETTYDDIAFRTSDWGSSVSDSTSCENGECISTKISPLPSSPLPFKLCHRNDFLSRPNCNEYTDCTKRIPEKKECPKGLHFNPTTRVCDWPFRADCGEITKPLYEPDDAFQCPCKTCLIPSTESCSDYYLCLGFTAYHLRCSENLRFDTNLNTCNYAPVVSCLLSTTSARTITTDKKPTDSYTTITSSLATTKAPTTTTPIPRSSTSKPEKFICPSREGLFKHPGSCEMFYQCSNWYPHVMHCPATTHFSEATKRCEYPCDAKCDSNLRCGRSTTKHPKDPRCSCQNCKLPSPETCTAYIVCVNGNARIDRCPWGQTFDARKSSCDWANKVMCNHTEICPERNGLFPFKDDCHKFVHCGNGIPYIKKCPSILEFDPVKKRCEWPAGRCGRQLPSDKESSSVKEEQHRDGFRCPKTYGYFSDDHNCNKFYHCSYGTPTLRECSAGLVYNPKYQTCDWKKHVRCNSNRHQKPKRCRTYDNRLKCPSNRKPVPHTLCNMYYDCTDGRACAKQCPVGLYYNRTTETCDLPENVKCYDAHNADYSLQEFSSRCLTHDDGRMPNPSDAACFYRCRQGKVISGCCSKGYVYNEHGEKCERKPKSLNI